MDRVSQASAAPSTALPSSLLPPSLKPLFPPSTRTGDQGLIIGGCSLADIAAEFGTPTFVVDEQGLRAQARAYREGFRHRRGLSKVAFASKSFPCRAVYRLMYDEGLLIDVAGGGELVMALDAGVDPSKLVLHGNAKSDGEIGMAIDAGIGTIVIDSIAEIDRIDRMLSRAQRVMLRVQPGVDPMTQAGVSTGHHGSKFGISLLEVPEAVALVGASRWLDLEGLHLHLGSQMLHLQPWVEAVKAVCGLGTFDVYDLGGGLGVQYTRHDTAPSLEQYLDVVASAAADHLPDTATIVIEPGRSLVARSTATVYTVMTVKPGNPTYVAVDGGMADNFEASTYFGQRFDATLVNRQGGELLVNVVGRQCESGDQIAREVRLDSPEPGDLLSVPMTGAYTHTLVNNYNGALRPAVVFCADGRARAVVRRDTYQDLLAREQAWP